MGLIFLMFALQTIHIASKWYVVWLGFIYYGEAPDQTSDVFQLDEAIFSLHVISLICNLLVTLKLAIADSIMVSTCLSFPSNTTNNL